jgi:lysine decarboxylase
VPARTERIDPARLDVGVEATATTSPAGAILASTDASRALLERDGRELLGESIAATRAARERLKRVEGLTVLDGPGVDPVTLTLVLPGTGADGNAVERDLTTAGMPVESADRDVLIAIVSLADTPETLARFAEHIATSIGRHRGDPRPPMGPVAYAVEPEVVVPPCEAFFAVAESVGVDDAVSRVGAEFIAAYPPGIPLLAPGEEVTPAMIEALVGARAAGSGSRTRPTPPFRRSV